MPSFLYGVIPGGIASLVLLVLLLLQRVKLAKMEGHLTDIEGKLAKSGADYQQSERIRTELQDQLDTTNKSLRHDKLKLAQELERVVAEHPDSVNVQRLVMERLRGVLKAGPLSS